VIVLEVSRAAGEEAPVRTGFSVPKKKFKKAVERNRVKRLLREAWRLQKQELYQTVPAEKQLHIFFLYTAAERPDFSSINSAMQKAVSRLAQNSGN